MGKCLYLHTPDAGIFFHTVNNKQNNRGAIKKQTEGKTIEKKNTKKRDIAINKGR